MRRVLALIALLGAVAPTAFAQSPPTTTIRGRVISAETGDPVRNARVGFDENAALRPALTDADGRFLLEAVPASQREVTASKTGFATLRAPADDGVEIRLVRSGSIAGRVLDDLGVPMPLVTVVAQRITRTGASIHVEPFSAVETDDTGEYRLFGLPAGAYLVGTSFGRIAADTGRTATRDAPSHNFYPHADAPEDAQPIVVAPGDEKGGIDLLMQLPPALPQSSAPPAGSQGVIQGRVVTAGGVAARRVRVQLMSADATTMQAAGAQTDEEGRYSIRGLRPGSYFVLASSMSGTERAAYGQHGPADPGTPVTVKAGAVADHIDIALGRGQAISGRIMDEYGEPMANANVRVDAIVMFRGRRQLAAAPNVASRQTDDRGRFRIFGLQPGRYILSAVVGESVPGWRTADWPGYARTYFPGVPGVAEALPIELGPGEDALTADFALVRGHLARVAGRALTSAGAPLQGRVSMMQSRRSGAIATGVVTTGTDGDGRFEFARVAPGEYLLQAASARPRISTEGDFAALYVTVDGVDVTNLAMQLSAGSTIAGRLILEGGDPPDDPDFRLSAIPVDPDLPSMPGEGPARAEIHDDGTFELSGISAPRRLQLTHAPEGWALKAVRVNGVDATDAVLPFGTSDQSLRDVEIVVTKRIATLTIAVGADDGVPRDVRLAVLSTDRSRWYAGSRFVAVGVPGSDGTARIQGLPPGEYYVAVINRARATAAAEAAEPGDEMSMFEPLVADATKVTIAEAQQATVSVKAGARGPKP